MPNLSASTFIGLMHTFSLTGYANNGKFKYVEEAVNMARIGVEPSLSNVKEALTRIGHEVVDLHSEEDAANCDFSIISGQDQNMMGIANVVTSGSVINAQGSTTDEVCQMLNERLH